MAPLPRSGLFGFLLLLGALLPSAGLAASRASVAEAPQAASAQQPAEAASLDSVEARLRRISAAIREQTPADAAEAAAEGKATGEKLAVIFVNGPDVGFRNGGWGNGGFRNGGWGNGGFRNGGWGNGFRNGVWGNGGGWRNGGFLNLW